MIKLKTIKTTSPIDFDTSVNFYLSEGWNIYELATGGTQTSAVLVAFLTKDEDE